MKSLAVHVSRDPLASVHRKKPDNLGTVWYELPTVLTSLASTVPTLPIWRFQWSPSDFGLFTSGSVCKEPEFPTWLPP